MIFLRTSPSPQGPNKAVQLGRRGFRVEIEVFPRQPQDLVDAPALAEQLSHRGEKARPRGAVTRSKGFEAIRPTLTASVKDGRHSFRQFRT